MPYFSLPEWQSLPEIELYMDQVVSIVEKALAPLPDGEGKAVTAAMVNNYVKQKALYPPVKKRYNRGHVCALLMICTLKRVLSMGEIKALRELLLETLSEEACYLLFRTELDRALNGPVQPPCAESGADGRAAAALRACCGALACKLQAQRLLFPPAQQ